MGRRLATNLAIVVIAVLVGVGLSIKPWQGYRSQKALADKNAAEMAAAEKSREELARKKAELSSRPGRELSARELGYMKSGERPLESGTSE